MSTNENDKKIIELETHKKGLLFFVESCDIGDTESKKTSIYRESKEEIREIDIKLMALYNSDHATKALEFLSFAYDEVIQLETTACNKDNAIALFAKLNNELIQFQEWQKSR